MKILRERERRKRKKRKEIKEEENEKKKGGKIPYAIHLMKIASVLEMNKVHRHKKETKVFHLLLQNALHQKQKQRQQEHGEKQHRGKKATRHCSAQ